jgi:hypothetical protein
MILMKKVSILPGVATVLIATVILIGGAFYFQYLGMQQLEKLQASVVQPVNPTAGPALSGVEGWKTYTDVQNGFELKFPDSWKGYSVVEQKWEGHVINNYQQTYSGPEIIIKNPQTTSAQQWQDIPIMVFTPDVWEMVSGNNPTVTVSAAPIGPQKIGENAKYVFATPPRWYGFTDDLGWQEAVDIVKTFKAF